MSAHEKEVAGSVVEQLRSQARQAGWAQDPVAWARDVLGVHMWSKQQDISHSVAENKRTVVASCHGTGKALSLEVPIPTPDGLVAMGDLNEGSKVYGADGRITRVIATTGHHTADRYRLVLLDGMKETVVIASGDHLWPVLDTRSRAMADLSAQRAGMPGAHYGVWHHMTKNMTTRELYERVMRHENFWLPGRIPALRERDEVWNPPDHIADRLMTKGVCDETGRAALQWTGFGQEPPGEMISMRQELNEAGMKTLLQRRRMNAASVWSLAFSSDIAVDLLPHPNDRALAHNRALYNELHSYDPGPSGWRIAAIERVPDGDVQCIQVEAPDSLYLCTEEGIPTHNSMIASVIACWWVSTRPIGEAIVVSTAPTYAQVNKILWEEIRRHHATAKRRGMPMVGYVTQGDEWKTSDGQILAFGRKPATGNIHGFQGIHRKYVLAIGDEACGLPEEIWTGIEAITTGESCRMLYIGNPDDRNTEFGKVFLKPEMQGMWNRISVPASSTPNFTGEKVPPLLNEVLVSKAWAEERRKAWGPKDPRYISKVEAQFPDVSKSSLFPPALISQAFDEVPPQMPGGVVKLGVDVARFGSDKTVVVSYAGRTARIESEWSGTDTTSSAHQVLRIAEEVKDRTKASWVEIRVDAVGLGAGVVDTLNARGVLTAQPWFSVYEMHGSAAAPRDLGGSVQGYGNARAYWFDQLRMAMRNTSVKVQEHEELRDDLGMIFYSYRNGKLFIASKEEMRSKHGKSPDYADALVYATAPVADGPQVGDVLSEGAEELLSQLDDLAGSDWENQISPY